ncbi:Alpha/beta hydrolase fold-3 [Penicillium expansum]|nr:Alpha/beta hydrolase fold-3 [Penicillium expansum]
MSTPDYFTSDPDWEAFATKNDIPLPSTTPPSAPIDFTQLDFASIREYEATNDTKWAEKHPIEEVGYTTKSTIVRARDGANINVKVSFPLSDRLHARGKGNDKFSLPVLFVTHGGGWVQGSHISEELWLLYPLYKQFDLVIVSVEYRLAPENRFPIWIEDSEDVLDALVDSPERLLGLNTNLSQSANINADLSRLILAGSSSGAGISAALSQICRDKGIPVNGVILNVPMLCDPRHFPVEYGPSKESLRSYTQCMDIFMGSSGLLAVWNLIHPDPASGLNIKASPLLGDIESLPRHLIFVAGQDPLRDEGIAYARKLEEGNVPVTLHVYKGVPHNFGHFWELQATKAFWGDLRATLEKWLS